jgi:hypothetical protein
VRESYACLVTLSANLAPDPLELFVLAIEGGSAELDGLLVAPGLDERRLLQDSVGRSSAAHTDGFDASPGLREDRSELAGPVAELERLLAARLAAEEPATAPGDLDQRSPADGAGRFVRHHESSAGKAQTRAREKLPGTVPAHTNDQRFPPLYALT